MTLSDMGVLWGLVLQGVLWLARPGVLMPVLGLVALMLLLRRPAQPGRRLGLWAAGALLLAPAVGVLWDASLIMLMSFISSEVSLGLLLGAFGWARTLLLAAAVVLLGRALRQALAGSAGEGA